MGIKQSEKDIEKAIDVIRAECDYHMNQGHSGSCSMCPFLLDGISFCGIVSADMLKFGNYKKAPYNWERQTIRIMQKNKYTDELIKEEKEKK